MCSLTLLPTVIQDVGPYLPTHGAVEIARHPLPGGAFDLGWVANTVTWAAVFGLGAMLLFQRDTRRT